MIEPAATGSARFDSGQAAYLERFEVVTNPKKVSERRMGRTFLFFGVETDKPVDYEKLIADAFTDFLKTSNLDMRQEIPDRITLRKMMQVEILDIKNSLGGNFLYMKDTLVIIDGIERDHVVFDIPDRSRIAALVSFGKIAEFIPKDVRLSKVMFIVVREPDDKPTIAPAAKNLFRDPIDKQADRKNRIEKLLETLSPLDHAVISMVRNGASRSNAIDVVYGSASEAMKNRAATILSFIKPERLDPLPPEAFVAQ